MLNDKITMQNMRRLPLTATHLTAEAKSSILVLVCTNIKEQDITTIVLQTGLSDHTAQLCNLELSQGKNTTVNLKRETGKSNLKNLKSILLTEKWDLTKK